jgi:2-iminobutanoate/2-iminopropanoate deaminase
MPKKRVVRTEKAPAPFQGAPYSQGIVVGDLVFVSGQVAIDPETNKVIKGDIEEQTDLVMRNIAAILHEAGSTLQKLVRCGIFLADFDDFDAMNKIYARHVGAEPPARATVQVAKLPSGVRVEIDAIAHL